jgi:hypothetical protein
MDRRGGAGNAGGVSVGEGEDLAGDDAQAPVVGAAAGSIQREGFPKTASFAVDTVGEPSGPSGRLQPVEGGLCHINRAAMGRASLTHSSVLRRALIRKGFLVPFFSKKNTLS